VNEGAGDAKGDLRSINFKSVITALLRTPRLLVTEGALDDWLGGRQ
jgi:hypothetical protein